MKKNKKKWLGMTPEDMRILPAIVCVYGGMALVEFLNLSVWFYLPCLLLGIYFMSKVFKADPKEK